MWNTGGPELVWVPVVPAGEPGAWTMGAAAQSLQLADSVPGGAVPSSFAAVANDVQDGGAIVVHYATSSTYENPYYMTQSHDGFQSLEGITGGGPWELAAIAPSLCSGLNDYSLDVEPGGLPQLYFHKRCGVDDYPMVARVDTLREPPWVTVSPKWDQLWGSAAVVDSDRTLHVFGAFEAVGAAADGPDLGTSNPNPQHCRLDRTDSVGSRTAVGNWSWGTQRVHSCAAATDGTSVRLLWQYGATMAIGNSLWVRNYDGSLWGPTCGSIFTSQNGEAMPVRMAHDMVQGTSHLLWTDIAPTPTPHYVMLYRPIAVCAGTDALCGGAAKVCGMDEDCNAGTCEPR